MHSVYNETESAAYLGLKNWEIIPSEIKTLTLLQVLNKELSAENLIIAHADYAKPISKKVLKSLCISVLKITYIIEISLSIVFAFIFVFLGFS